MTFGEALQYVMAGGRARRSGWNGKGMWIAYTPPSVLAPYEFDGAALAHRVCASIRGAVRVYAETESPSEIRLSGHFDMRAADGTLVVGWLASQTDMAAEDWERVE